MGVPDFDGLITLFFILCGLAVVGLIAVLSLALYAGYWAVNHIQIV